MNVQLEASPRRPAARIVSQRLAPTGATRDTDRFEEMQALTTRRSHGLRKGVFGGHGVAL
jgi:hypothetical protein